MNAINRRNVVYAGTSNLYGVMRVALTSLLANNRIDKVYLLIEDDAFPYDVPKNVKVVNVKNQQYFPPEGANYKTRWTYMTLMRCAITKLFPRMKRALWLDCDTIVDADISELFEGDMGNNYFAGVKEPGKCFSRTYINAGVLLMNLEQIRKDGLDDRLITLLNTKKLQYTDQDAINSLAQGRIIPIDSKYNVCQYTEPTGEKKIYHFAAQYDYSFEPLYIKYHDRKVW